MGKCSGGHGKPCSRALSLCVDDEALNCMLVHLGNPANALLIYGTCTHFYMLLLLLSSSYDDFLASPGVQEANMAFKRLIVLDEIDCII